MYGKTLKSFLNDYKITTSKDNQNTITHTRIPDTNLKIHGGSYSIPEDQLPIFYSLIYDHIIDKKIFEPFPLSIKIHIYCLFVNFMMHNNLNILLYVQPLPNMAKIIEDNLKIEQIEYDENDKNNIIAVTQPPGRDGFPTTRNNGFKIEFEKIYKLYNNEIPIEFRGTGDNYLTNTGYCILQTTSEKIKLFYDYVKEKFCNIDIFYKDEFIHGFQKWIIITLNEGDVRLTNDNFKL